MTTREILKEALSAALPGSKPFSDASAEKIVEAMEAHFRKLGPAYKPAEWIVSGDWKVGGDIASSVSGSFANVYVMKDPDVAELLAALDEFFLSFACEPFIISKEANQVRTAYEAVKTKYA